MLKCKIFCLFVVITIITAIFTNNAYSIDIKTIIDKTKDKDMTLNKGIKDITIMMHDELYSIKGLEITVKTTLSIKGTRVREEAEIIDVLKPGVIEKQISDGTNLWKLTAKGKIRIMGPIRKPNMEDFNNVIKYWENPTDNVKILGEEKVNGHDCYKLFFPENESNPDQNLYLWIDKNGFFKVKEEFKDTGIFKLWSDYKKINGKWDIPFKTETFYSNGKIFSRKIIDKFEINRDLPDSYFDLSDIKDAPKESINIFNFKKIGEILEEKLTNFIYSSYLDTKDKKRKKISK